MVKRIFLVLWFLLLPFNSYSAEVFTEDFSSGDKSNWDDSSANLTVVSERLQRIHVQSTTSTGSADKGFGDNAVSGFQTLTSTRVDDATIGADVEFSTNAFPSDGTTKIMILESWPTSSYPATTDKDFQAIVEIDGQPGHVGEIAVTIKREDFDYYTRYQASTPVTITANTVYNIKLRIKLDSPYTASNGELQLWIDDVLKIDNSDEDFILTARGSDLPKGLNTAMLTGYTGGSGSPDTKTQYWDNIVLSTVLSAGSSTRLFYENFDDTPSEQTTEAGCNTYSAFAHLGRTSGAGVDGDHSILQTGYGGDGYFFRTHHGNGGTGTQDSFVSVSSTLTGEMYVSFYYRLSTYYGIELATIYSHKNVRLWRSDDTNMSNLVQEAHIYGTMVMDAGPQGDPTNPVPPPPLLNVSRWGYVNEPDHAAEFSSDTFGWHKYEMYIKYDDPAGTGNGEQKIWIDDVVQVDRTSVQINVSSTYDDYTRVSLPSNYSYGYGPGTNLADYDLDEIEIWDGMPGDSLSLSTGQWGSGTGLFQ